VDFRELVKVLASEFRTRIELRQINPREHVALFGAVGQCGRSSCCCAHLARPPMIEIAMVENQRLGKNPAKLNGVCGRLKCCLKYENDFYTEEYAGIPPRNTLVECPDGRRGYICSANIFLKTVTIRHEEGGCAEYDFDTVRKMSPVDKKNRNNGQNNKNQNNSSSEG
jgi:cell fate regulator YaaT (PSP1 superfamily)